MTAGVNGGSITARSVAARSVAADRGRAPLRLTARGRRLVAALRTAGVLIALAVMATAVVLAGTAVLAPRAQADDDGGAPASVRVVVSPGDTLWQIALDVAPDRDPRAVVADITGRNGLVDGQVLQAGQVVLVPRG